MRPTRPLVLYGGALVAAAYLVAPFLWLLLTSLMTEAEALSVPPHWIPEAPTLANYAFFLRPTGQEALLAAGAALNFPRAMLNSAIVASSVALINICLGTPAAYSFARYRFPGDGTLLMAYIASRMVPGVALMIPLYIVMRHLGLLDTLVALIIVDSTFTLPFTIWILKSYFQTIPRDLEDAARVDRCNWLQTMVQVFLPVAKPGIAAAAMFAFMSAWGEFLFALVFSSTSASKPLTVAVSELATDISIQYTLMATSGVIAIIVPLCLALLFQRLIVQGLVAGSVKG